MDQDAKDFLLKRLFARREEARTYDLDRAEFGYRNTNEKYDELCKVCGSYSGKNTPCESCKQLLDFGLASPDGVSILDDGEEVLIAGDDKYTKAHEYVMQLPVIEYEDARTLPWGSKVHLVTAWDDRARRLDPKFVTWGYLQMFRRYGIVEKKADDYGHIKIYEADFPLSSKPQKTNVGRKSAVSGTKKEIRNRKPVVIKGKKPQVDEATTDDKLRELVINGSTAGERQAAFNILMKRGQK